MECPACGHGDVQLHRRYSVHSAAQHFVPRQRDPERYERLLQHLSSVLWHQDYVEVHICSACAFGFSVPLIGGDARFYALVHEGASRYPSDRWEFGETLRVLRQPDFSRPLRVAEVGAGSGAFLDQLCASPHGDAHQVVAADFDLGAVSQLSAKGYNAIAGSLTEMAHCGDEPFDVVCLFQTLEHMADIDGAFSNLTRLLKPGGSVFVSVPNGDAIAFQEAATGLWDMPPNHVGRWGATAISRAAAARGFQALEVKLQPIQPVAMTWHLAVSCVNARAYVPGTVASRVNAITSPRIRGALKRALAASRAPRLLAQRQHYRPQHCWAHLMLSG